MQIFGAPVSFPTPPAPSPPPQLTAHLQVVCDARSSELPKYGIKTGLTNYPAAYAVGLLLARRLNQKYGLDETYQGKIQITSFASRSKY